MFLPPGSRLRLSVQLSLNLPKMIRIILIILEARGGDAASMLLMLRIMI